MNRYTEEELKAIEIVNLLVVVIVIALLLAHEFGWLSFETSLLSLLGLYIVAYGGMR